MSNESKWYQKDSNAQTSGWKALLTWPGCLFILLPLGFLGGWGMQNLLDGAPRLDGKAFRTAMLSTFGMLFLAWLWKVLKSDNVIK